MTIGALARLGTHFNTVFDDEPISSFYLSIFQLNFCRRPKEEEES